MTLRNDLIADTKKRLAEVERIESGYYTGATPYHSTAEITSALWNILQVLEMDEAAASYARLARAARQLLNVHETVQTSGKESALDDPIRDLRSAVVGVEKAQIPKDPYLKISGYRHGHAWVRVVAGISKEAYALANRVVLDAIRSGVQNVVILELDDGNAEKYIREPSEVPQPSPASSKERL